VQNKRKLVAALVDAIQLETVQSRCIPVISPRLAQEIILEDAIKIPQCGGLSLEEKKSILAGLPTIANEGENLCQLRGLGDFSRPSS
jgi:hypothetical protein